MSYVARAAFDPLPGREIEAQPSEAVVAMCLFGEARGADMRAKIAVAHVLLNRAGREAGRFYPKALDGSDPVTLAAACALKPYAFSCFLVNDPNRAKLLDGWRNEPKAWSECVAAAAIALDGLVRDPTHGANHYHTFGVGDQLLGRWPSWARANDQVAEIGTFKFYRLA